MFGSDVMKIILQMRQEILDEELRQHKEMFRLTLLCIEWFKFKKRKNLVNYISYHSHQRDPNTWYAYLDKEYPIYPVRDPMQPLRPSMWFSSEVSSFFMIPDTFKHEMRKRSHIYLTRDNETYNKLGFFNVHKRPCILSLKD